jgi:catechol 2,3-dioxygenase-like lactoylglutathione lyase family enzyme
MADLNLKGVSIVMLGVTDLERSTAFYVEKLGLRATGQVPGFSFLDGGGVALALSEPLARASRNLVGATEVVLGADDVPAAYDELRSRGVTFLNEPRLVDGVNWAADFADPDGHVLSIFGSGPAA